jgi:hypothetical protein
VWRENIVSLYSTAWPIINRIYIYTSVYENPLITLQKLGEDTKKTKKRDLYQWDLLFISSQMFSAVTSALYVLACFLSLETFLPMEALKPFSAVRNIDLFPNIPVR